MRRIRGLSSYSRRGPVRDPYDTVLIVCEGKKTEPNYLNGLKAAYRLSSANIRVTNAPGTDPMTIVTHTETLMGTEEYDRVFSVFDKDAHANFDAAVKYVADSKRGKINEWQAITSTPSFEVWLMLHYQFSTAPIVASGGKSAGDMAIETLKKYQPKYAKGSKDIYGVLHNLTDTAIKNAAKLITHNGNTGSSNPATNMHMLVEYLRKLKA